ncbi:MoaD/ThiS family protein [uncultured Planktosalinus sp.]
MKKKLQQQYPALVELTFSIAVNKKIIQQKTLLNPEDEVALLPPFSGG